MNLPEQGSSIIIPEESRRQLPFTSNYGIPKPPSFKPIQDLNIPEQGPLVIIPEESRRQVPFSSTYGVPSKPITFAPISDLNIPGQGPQLIIPEESRRQVVPSITSSGYGIPSNEIDQELFGTRPLEDLNLPGTVHT